MISGLLSGLVLRFGGGRLIGIGLVFMVVAAAGIYVWSLKSAAEAAEAQAIKTQAAYEAAVQAAETNLIAWRQLKDEAGRAFRTLEAERKAAKAIAARVAALQREIDRAETQHTGCVPGNDDQVAPVLDLVLDGAIGGVLDATDAEDRHQSGG